MVESRRSRAGIVLGMIVVLLWSSSSALIYLGGRSVGVWQFVALSMGLGAICQLVAYAVWKRDLRRRLALPGRLWLALIFGFVLYELLYPWAISASVDPAQVCGVNLINYLWPILTVVCSVLWVQGIRLTWRLGAGIVLSLAGLALANMRLLGLRSGPEAPVWPYLLIAVAAVAWAIYSSLLARWRDWAGGYTTAPIGFLAVSAVTGCICAATGRWQPLDTGQWALVLLFGIGPCGAGYMLWELALHRAPASVLGMMSATIPILSTLLLCAVQRYLPDPWLIIGAACVSLAVILTVRRGRRQGRR